jgi:cyclopropane-fatty-acyl-phospholipid synthase
MEQARVWRLYLVGGALAFEQNRMGVDQILSVKATADGRSGMPPTRLGWEPHASRGTLDDQQAGTPHR